MGKARSQPYSRPTERCFTQVGSSLTHKRKTTLKWLARNKPSNLLETFPNYGRKILYNIGPRPLKTYSRFLYHKTLRIRILRKMGRLRSKLVSFLLSETNTLAWKNTSLDKHTSLLRNPKITNLYCFIVRAPVHFKGQGGLRELKMRYKISLKKIWTLK